MKITGALIVVIVIVDLARGQTVLTTVLFALAVAVGLTPQLLPALVSLSLARGSAELATREVVVKRLVAIEDLGSIDVLYTDKTGTLTAGQITLHRSTDPIGDDDVEVWRLPRLCSDVTMNNSGVLSGGNPLDRALWDDPTGPDTRTTARLALLPFDHDRQLTSVLVDDPTTGRFQITKGAPEAVLHCCKQIPDGSRAFLDSAFANGLRVMPIATRSRIDSNRTDLAVSDETELELAGFVTFLDPPKPDVAESLAKLGRLVSR